MIHRLLVLAAIVCCGLVAASFALFTQDQLAGASKHQQDALSNPTALARRPAAAPVAAEPRRFIDGAARTLTSPFHSIVQSSSQWVDHIVPTALALLAYGLGLGYLARYSRGLS